MKFFRLAFCYCCFALFCGGASTAAANDDSEWPCVQRLVPQLSPGAMWPHPQLLPAVGEDWRLDGDTASLAATLAARGAEAVLSSSRLDEFIAEAPNPARRLGFLFAGTVNIIDKKRARRLRAIFTFARRQRELSDKITADQSAIANGANGEIASRLRWSERLYDERERRLRFLCETPVELEQRAFAIARMLSARAEELP